MGKRRRSVVAVVMALTLVLVFATAVAATVTKSGTRTCATNYTPYSRSYSTGFTEHFPPGSGYYSWNNGSTWIVRKRYADHAGGGGWWEVAVTSGSLSDSGTYAGCDPTGF